MKRWSILFKGLIFILALQSHALSASTTEPSPRFVVHLLDYLAKDYGGAVLEGKIVSQSEYQEQVDFINAAVETGRQLKEISSPEIQSNLKRLQEMILSKESAKAVAQLSRKIQLEVIELTKLDMAPLKWPNLRHGAKIYSENCTACHGEHGTGDGPASAGLEPKPANFLDQSRMIEISPFQEFNVIRLGVPGTAMAPFQQFSDQDTWDLAFYLLSLRHGTLHSNQDHPAFVNSSITLNRDDLTDVASLSDETLENKLSQRKMTDVKITLSALRTYSKEDDAVAALSIARLYLKEARHSYLERDLGSAKTKAIKAYLEGVEPIEPRLKANDPDAVIDIENIMATIRSGIEQEKPVNEISNMIELAEKKIDHIESLLSKKTMSPEMAFVSAATILLREGFEAVLVILALLGVIQATGAKTAAKWVHGGWLTAIGLGVLTWFFSGWVLSFGGERRELMEALSSLFAVTVLLYVGFWLHNQTEIGRWREFLDGRVKTALEQKNLIGLAVISFVAVFREAFETVLFLRAIWLEGAEPARLAMAIGVCSSFVLVIIIAWFTLKYTSKIPIRKLFTLSSSMMAVLALILTGKGIHSLQETGLLSVTISPLNFRWDIFGFYPTIETLGAQIFVVGMVVALWISGRQPSNKTPSVAAN